MVEPADILEKAAELYESGQATWVPHGKGEGDALCALQCLSKASMMGRSQEICDIIAHLGFGDVAKKALKSYVGEAVTSWNDSLDPGSQEIVVDALKAAAKNLRNQ